MGALVVAKNLMHTSHLWMRRMLDCIDDDVAILGVIGDNNGYATPRFPRVAISSEPSLLQRAMFRAGILRDSPWRSILDKKLVWAMEQQSVTVVLVHYLSVAVKHSEAWKRTTKRVFIHCHGGDVTWDKRSDVPPYERKFDADYVERVLALPKHVEFIANSISTQQKLTEIGIDPGRIHIKYLGVEVPDQPPVRTNASDEIRILYLGNLVDFKGPDLVISAFDRACAAGLKGNLTVAGDGVLRTTCELLRGRSKFADKIHLIGKVDAAHGAKLRESADVFTAHNCTGAISGQVEAFGVSIIEGMAAALPVIAGRSGGVKETLVDGETGILIEPGDVDAHASAFLRLARDPELRSQMGRGAWKRAAEHFSLQREGTQLRRILGLRGEGA